MINFSYENGNFYYNKEDGKYPYEVRVEFITKVSFEIENGYIKKPNVSKISLVCNCGIKEEVSKEFFIDNSDNDYTYIKPIITK